jgi:GMP synthase (glutamine-hydrolysing)
MILVIDMSWRKASLGYYEFVSPLISAIQGAAQVRVKHYSELSPQDIDQSSKIILSGTALKDNAVLGQSEKFRWLKTTEKPVLGICAGMQTIAQAYGAQLTRGLEIGMTQIETLQENPLFSGAFSAYSLHSFCVESPVDFEVLAKSTQCIQAIKHRQKPLYGVLFHPEVRNVDVLKRFVALKSE